ncbi:MAG: NTP transferase domain-containing protein [Proteobacteria bacterium]|nr:NTP transferase domain-containing protein [Pseudomonadota bacterium]
MAEKITTAMILAAGMGTRLRPLTDNTPKPLIEVGGEPVIGRMMRLLHGAGIGRVVINTHYMAEALREGVLACAPAGLEVLFSHEEVLLETGGGLKKALPLLGEAPFLVVNSDEVWCEDKAPFLKGLMEAFDPASHDALLTVVPKARTESYQPLGDFQMGNDKRLSRGGAREGWDFVYVGVHVTHPAFIASEQGQAFGLMRIWEPAMQEGRLHGYLYDNDWADMGTHAGLHHARELVVPGKG